MGWRSLPWVLNSWAQPAARAALRRCLSVVRTSRSSSACRRAAAALRRPYPNEATLTNGLAAAADTTATKAVLKFPGDPQTWFRLAAFQLGTLDHPNEAADTVQGAIYLDPRSYAYRMLYLQARARARELER